MVIVFAQQGAGLLGRRSYRQHSSVPVSSSTGSVGLSQTEMPSRQSGRWCTRVTRLVCMACVQVRVQDNREVPVGTTIVLEEMRTNIALQLRGFWDAGIRGPDFVWAATGPAMEAYSKHPVVRKANAPGEVMGVGEFLNHVRRMVVDYIVGQVLTGETGIGPGRRRSARRSDGLLPFASARFRYGRRTSRSVHSLRNGMRPV